MTHLNLAYCFEVSNTGISFYRETEGNPFVARFEFDFPAEYGVRLVEVGPNYSSKDTILLRQYFTPLKEILKQYVTENSIS